LPDDYNGSTVEKIIQIVSEGKVPVNAEKDKAMQAVYEVIMGQDRGAGKEDQNLVPVGIDLTDRFKLLQKQYSDALEAFESITNHVAMDK
jgi:hypothetical protein